LVKDLAENHYDEEWKCNHLYLFDKEIEIYNGWGPGKYVPEKLIQNSRRIDGYNFSNIKDVLRWKTERGLEKDKKHIKMIYDYLENTPNSTPPSPLH